MDERRAAEQLANLLRFEHFFGAYEVCIDVGMSHADALECSRQIAGTKADDELQASPAAS
jgi:hypothetical protein